MIKRLPVDPPNPEKKTIHRFTYISIYLCMFSKYLIFPFIPELHIFSCNAKDKLSVFRLMNKLGLNAELIKDSGEAQPT